MIKNIKSSLLIIFSTIFISSCGSVQKALDPQNKNTSDEFLVEKKSPLSMPPSFEELPVPSNQKITQENQTNSIKSSLLIIFSTILITNCGTVQKAFDPQNKNTSEEFLVEKKSPLSIPPSFEELPVPSNEKVNKENQINNIESLITEESNNEKLETVESDKDFEQSILDKIKNN